MLTTLSPTVRTFGAVDLASRKIMFTFEILSPIGRIFIASN